MLITPITTVQPRPGSPWADSAMNSSTAPLTIQ